MDFSHHLSQEARIRVPNPMKEVMRVVLSRPGIVTLANGNPHPNYFPISKVEFQVPKLEGDNIIGDWVAGKLSQFSLSSYDDESANLNLKPAMQYGLGAGAREVCSLLEELNLKIHSTAPNNHVTLHLGNSDGAAKCFRLLADPGDTFLVEEFSFPGLTTVPMAHGVRWAPIKIDGDGLIPEDMDRILTEWDEDRMGKRPRVLYTIPCGQNPTGSTLSSERKRQAYALAQKWDIIIIEDDPYFFLQYQNEAGSRQLQESFASLDVDGRVIRLDTFSKLITPGLRLGWFTSNKLFQHHLEVLADASTQQPHGLGQVFISELLAPAPRGWGFDGYILWCKKIADEYQRKRDLLLNHLEEGFAERWGDIAIADVPKAGMFACLQIAVEKHHSFKRSQDSPDGRKTNTLEVMEALFNHLLDSGVMVIPAASFAIEDTSGVQKEHVKDRVAFFRVAFVGEDEVIIKGAKLVAAGVRSFFNPPVNEE